MNALYPLFIKAHQKSEKALLPFMLKSGLIMGSIGLFGTVITYALSPFLIRLVAGDLGFEGSIETLRILSFSFPAFFLSAVLMWGLVTLHLNKRMLAIYLIGLVTNFTLNFIYIPQYSYIAASWVTVFCEYLILLLQLVILIRYFKS
jgi:O-antigen/teichoic acid export membrane protein